MLSVARDVCLKFVGPEIRPRRGSGRKPTTFVAMPEAPVHENDCPVSGKDEVGAAGEALVMQPEAEALCMHGLS